MIPSVRTVLLVAFHFPPLVGSSGLQRTLRFAQYLPEFGWKPVVLTVTPAAMEQSDPATLDQIPPGCTVVRVPCFDTARHLSIAGRYPGFLTIPDRWMSWAWLGLRPGLRACQAHGVQAVWSTYPIASAHRLGGRIARHTGLPWIADFRDPMAQPGYPADPRRWRAYRAIEQDAARHAARMVFVTPSALAGYRALFPDTPAERFALLENGYDESVFAGAQARAPQTSADRPLILLHSGVVYPSERDPRGLFDALAALQAAGRIHRGEFLIRFRAAAHEQMLRTLAAERGVEEFIEIAPPVPYRQAIEEMMSVDALLVMQGRNCNAQIPAKLYEYLRAGRPILGLADPQGDTGGTLRAAGVEHVATMEDADAVAALIPDFLAALRAGHIAAVPPSQFERFSRRALSARLAGLLDTVVERRTP